MKSLNMMAYGFSISWPRIMPNGTGAINARGIAFYNFLIDTLLHHGIEPWCTLFHWDLPQQLYTQHGGWLNREDATIQAFEEYARLCFLSFGGRVKKWITINEGWTVSVNGHGTGIHAPGHVSSTEPYVVGHNVILAQRPCLQNGVCAAAEGNHWLLKQWRFSISCHIRRRGP
mmetsp:Transcript_5789/g.16231  ORF Transcript_5789/g.16231 Transcript_5789/m.16231 type:complete len:173 (+) Transcript_5789:139-657(+)